MEAMRQERYKQIASSTEKSLVAVFKPCMHDAPAPEVHAVSSNGWEL